MTIFEATYENKHTKRTVKRSISISHPEADFDEEMDMYMFAMSQAYVDKKDNEKLTKVELISG